MSTGNPTSRAPEAAPGGTIASDLKRERESGDALNAAVQGASLDGILLVDSQEKILSYNQHFVELWGISPELMAGKSDVRVLEMVAGQVIGRDAFVARVKQLYADVEGYSRDDIPLKDGRILDRYSAPVRLGDGTYIFIRVGTPSGGFNVITLNPTACYPV